MKKLTKNSGLTLIELVAASIITVFIMIGVASMDISLRNMFQGISSSSAVASRASIVMHHISRNILEAAGTSQTGGPGIGVYVDALQTHLWIRKDDPQSPQNYVDDIWYLYKYDPGTYTLSYGTDAGVAYNALSPVETPSFVATQTFSNILTFAPGLISNDNVNCQFSVPISLTAIYDATLPLPSDPSYDANANPECTLTSIFSIPDTGNTI